MPDDSLQEDVYVPPKAPVYRAPLYLAKAPREYDPRQNILHFFFEFEGRFGRGQFIFVHVVLALVYFVAVHPTMTREEMGVTSGPRALEAYLAENIFLVVLHSSFCAQFKRWHDLGRSGAWAFVTLFFVVPLIVLFTFAEHRLNELMFAAYHLYLFKVVGLFYAIWAFFQLFVCRGLYRNEYGDSVDDLNWWPRLLPNDVDADSSTKSPPPSERGGTIMDW